MQKHECAQNSFNQTGIQVIFGATQEEGWKDWILRVTSVATAQDVSDGEATDVGEVVNEHSFVIHYCPFCGKELSQVSMEQNK